MKKKEPTLWYLFRTFFKIGSSSFGGFIALIAIIQEQLSEKDKVLEDNIILEGISLTSILPGPTAVNTVAYVGYKLRGMSGAFVSMGGVILPAFILICLLSHLYFEYGQKIHGFNSALAAILPTVCAIILSTTYTMVRKSIHDLYQGLIVIVSIIFFFLIPGVLSKIILIILGGITGYFLYHTPSQERSKALFSPQEIFLVRSNSSDNLLKSLASFEINRL